MQGKLTLTQDRYDDLYAAVLDLEHA